jgi:orotidine-5'-phosphate decarboxylase
VDNPIIVAMDGLRTDEVEPLVEKLRDHVWGFKFNDLFFRHGLSLLPRFPTDRIMLDAKLHDIPNTVANTTEPMKQYPAIHILTVHASGGREMIAAAAANLPEKIAAVTVLTSLHENQCKEIFCQTPGVHVGTLAEIAFEGGASHMVCSPLELELVQDIGLKKIVPGIRPVWHTTPDDQKRVATPAAAVEAGANFLVIGRPILQADDPVEAAQKTLDEIKAG